MSTRGAIARWTDRDKGEWEGNYHHWDSYPSGLGATLYELGQRRDLEQLVKVLIDDHPAGWSTINGANWDLTIGFTDIDSCGVCGVGQYGFKDRQGQSTRQHAEVEPEPFPHEYTRPAQCYCHGSRKEAGSAPLTPKEAAEIGVEWVYVIDPERRTMTVLEASADGRHSVGMFGQGNPEATFVERAVVGFDGPPPDWDGLD